MIHESQHTTLQQSNEESHVTRSRHKRGPKALLSSGIKLLATKVKQTKRVLCRVFRRGKGCKGRPITIEHEVRFPIMDSDWTSKENFFGVKVRA